jgi:hypothetical protein
MNDFVDTLEAQLLAAHGRRPRAVPPWRAGIVLVAAVAAAAIVVALVAGLSSPHSQPAARPPATHHAPVTTIKSRPSDVALAVLNGTTITGLARHAADELTANGYLEPNVVTNDTTNQSRQTTEVYYESGKRSAALGVAGCLNIGFDHVHPMNANARALADRAQVAVFLGADRAR